ncbi:MAG TPA: hypothetical protein VN687_10800 [Blastocatellia bacterium]|nr:hypothetical protein [Blastocatellia bacterium]
MTLAEAISQFLEGVESSRFPHHSAALELLSSYFSSDRDLSEITPAKLRDFLSHWYVERMFGYGSIKSEDASNARQSIDSLTEFLKWTKRHAANPEDSLAVLDELRVTVPRALEIAGDLLSCIGRQRGAFNFPEFLTSFEEGGRSEYDIDTPGDVGALEGYFRVVRVEGSMVEAEELTSEDRIWPIIFPAEIASSLETQYIINLELVRAPEGWKIVDCGVVYPPGTEI